MKVIDVRDTYWHTPQDTLDKVDPRSLAIVGHVFVEIGPALEKKSRYSDCSCFSYSVCICGLFVRQK
jgi:hypothetical protein